MAWRRVGDGSAWAGCWLEWRWRGPDGRLLDDHDPSAAALQVVVLDGGREGAVVASAFLALTLQDG